MTNRYPTWRPLPRKRRPSAISSDSTLAPLPAVGRQGPGRWISAPLADIQRSIYEDGAIMYPVSNRSFRDWRAKHIQGGDFIAYTPPKPIRLARSIKVSLA